MRLRALSSSTVSITAAVLLAAGVAAVPAAAAPTGVAPSAAGDLLEVTSVLTPPLPTRPSGSLLARTGQARLTSTSPADLRLRGTDPSSGAVASLTFAAPTGTAFAARARASRTYDLAQQADRRHGAFRATVNGQSCVLQTGYLLSSTLTVDEVVSGPNGITGFRGRYQVSCQSGWQLRGVVSLGLDSTLLYTQALATPLGVHDLGALPVGSSTQVVLPFTYRGTTPGYHYPAGTLTVVAVPNPGTSGYEYQAAPDAPVTATTCDLGGLLDGDQCTVTVQVTPSAAGRGNFVVHLGAAVGGYTAYTYRGVAAA